MSRYKSTKRFRNNLEYYSYLRKSRDLPAVNHLATPILRNPTIADRTNIMSDSHIWALGDRFYKLAHKYYGSPEYWWVIAWYNSTPTEVDVSFGDMIEIPINLSSVFEALGLIY